MNTGFLKIGLPIAMIAGVLFCASGGAVIGTLDAGGARTSSASCVNNGSLGWIENLPASSSSCLLKPGYVGQLTEATNLTLTAAPTTLSETATAQLGGWIALEDGTAASVQGNEIAWSTATFPLLAISNGVAIPSPIYTNTSAELSGSYLGLTALLNLTVLDTNPDNFGSYAGDGLPDSWQVQYFGLPPNGRAAPGVDLFGTGNNLFKYVAGLNPTNPTSIFSFRIKARSTGGNDLIFSPRLADRQYSVLRATNLQSASWLPLNGAPVVDAVNQRTVSDLDTSGASKFYRVKIGN